MTQVVDFKSPEFWKAWYTKQEGYFGSPFKVKTDVASGEYYLWNQLDEPVPGGGTYGSWDFFNSPVEMAAYLRYMILPRFFQLLITMEGEEPHAFEFYDLVSLVTKTQQEVDWEDDEYALILTTLKGLDSVLEKEEVIFTDLKAIAAAFNTMWEHGSGWTFRICPFDDIVSAGETLFKNGFRGELPDDDEAREEFGHTLAEWKELCLASRTDTKVYASDILPSFAEPFGYI
ncbi:hypothetical protein DSLASN_30470 [Desulfoluna limicola]|uniref:Uncharacterized protein n=1 Tax=Desulfoluna limicola TaxID=2810562 RepID=A0ABN6FA74_9BACT|nr:hypothetical protein [Desulfoluna limicola]BCS97415.1 hypothetical protein DSLASN_30470 [Desulfoluna limicola]